MESQPGAPSWMTALPTETERAEKKHSVASSDDLDGLSSGTLSSFLFSSSSSSFFFFPSPPFFFPFLNQGGHWSVVMYPPCA